MYMMKLILLTIMKEKNTPNTMYKYSFKILGLLVEKRRFFVFCVVEDVDPRDEVLDMDDILTEIPAIF